MSDKTKDELVDELRRSYREVAELLLSMVDNQDWHPEPAEWSFRLIAAHLVAVEREYNLQRVRRIASGENPHFEYYSHSALDYGRQDLRTSLRSWAVARRELLDFVSSLPDSRLHLTGTQATIGEITVLDALADVVESDRGYARHVAQLIEDYYEAMIEA